MLVNQIQKCIDNGDSLDLIDHIQRHLCEVVDSSGVSSLSKERRVVYCVALYDILTNNAGYKSIFTGSYTEIVRYLVGSLKDIGLEECSKSFQSAIDVVFTDRIPEELSLFEDMVEQSIERDCDGDPFDQFEEPFWDMSSDNEDEIYNKLAYYVKDNVESFKDIL